jgi:hypothetical protein
MEFECRCGASNCRRVLKGFKHDHAEIRAHCGDLYAKYLHSYEPLNTNDNDDDDDDDDEKDNNDN